MEDTEDTEELTAKAAKAAKHARRRQRACLRSSVFTVVALFIFDRGVTNAAFAD